ncbi:TetR/AcrR family transcriptional regulator [Streptomyces sp. NPDC058525]|uniref:TetR/AcrR family transcriptional regulator n=1 Tax=unclassified Streptomyces TaxID=2593676 RepID=UPI0036540082
MVHKQNEGRNYSGLGPDERAKRRRTAVLAAALDLFGTQGYAPTSVKQICQAAGLTERYFYAVFRDRHACLIGLYGELTRDLRNATTAAIDQSSTDGELDAIITSGLTAFVDFLTADPRRARVVLIEVVGVSPELEVRRHGVLREFAELITAVWSTNAGTVKTARGTGNDTNAQRLTAVGLVGAVNHLLVDWLLSGREDEPAALVQVSTALFSAAHARVT